MLLSFSCATILSQDCKLFSSLQEINIPVAVFGLVQAGNLVQLECNIRLIIPFVHYLYIKDFSNQYSLQSLAVI